MPHKALSPRSHMLLSRAFARGFNFAQEGTGDIPPKKDDDKQKKIELTQEELDQRTEAAVQAALKKHDDAIAEQAKKDKEERDRKEQLEQGKHKDIADTAEKKRKEAEDERDAAKLEARKLLVKDKLRDALAKDHPEYVGVAGYIMPLIQLDLKTDDAAIDKQIKVSIEQYVKDNPRSRATSTPHNPGHTLPPARKTGEQQKENKSPTTPEELGNSYLNRTYTGPRRMSTGAN